jgi:hypothetical protein
VVKQNFRPDHHGIWPRRIFEPCEMSEVILLNRSWESISIVTWM